MEGEQFVLAIVAMAMGTGIIITVVTKGVDLIKSWINRNNASYDQEKFERLAKAFISHKKDMERRLQNIEAIVTDDEPGTASKSTHKLKKTQLHNTIEIDEADSKAEREESADSNLKNMLNKQRST